MPIRGKLNVLYAFSISLLVIIREALAFDLMLCRLHRILMAMFWFIFQRKIKERKFNSFASVSLMLEHRYTYPFFTEYSSIEFLYIIFNPVSPICVAYRSHGLTLSKCVQCIPQMTISRAYDTQNPALTSVEGRCVHIPRITLYAYRRHQREFPTKDGYLFRCFSTRGSVR